MDLASYFFRWINFYAYDSFFYDKLSKKEPFLFFYWDEEDFWDFYDLISSSSFLEIADSSVLEKRLTGFLEGNWKLEAFYEVTLFYVYCGLSAISNFWLSLII